MAASERAAEINARHRAMDASDGGVTLGLVEDAAHWSDCGIETAEQLDHYLAQAEHYDAYKDVHGIRPRWMKYSEMTTAEIEMETARLYASATSEEREPAPYVPDTTPLTFNPFAALGRK